MIFIHPQDTPEVAIIVNKPAPPQDFEWNKTARTRPTSNWPSYIRNTMQKEWTKYYDGLLLVDLYTKPKCNFISFKILGGGGLFTMIATSGVSWGWIKTIYRTLYLLGRQRDYEFREIGLSGPFYKGKYRENGQNHYFFFGKLIITKKTVR